MPGNCSGTPGFPADAPSPVRDAPLGLGER